MSGVASGAKATACGIAVLVLVGLGIYFPALRGDWIWDDALEVVNNAAIKGPLSALIGVWFAPAQTDYFPLKVSLQWIEWHLWGASLMGWHLASVGLHIFSACLLWRVLSRMGIAKAWWAGLLFLVHPLAVESVAWISELKNTLSLPLLLLSWDAHLSACERDEEGSIRVFSGSRLRSLGWFTAAMLAKSSVAMLPVCLLLHGWWRRGRITRRDLLASLPFFAISAGLGSVTVFFQETRAFGARDFDIGSWEMRAAESGAHILFYLGKFLWPHPLYPLYLHAAAKAPGWNAAWPWMLFLAFGLGFRFARTAVRRPAVFGLGWFVANLAPVLGIIPMAYMKYAWVADRFAYVPMLGLAALSAAAAGSAADRLESRSRALARAFNGAAIAALLALAFASHRQAGYYRDPATLWAMVVRDNPGAWAAHHNLAVALDPLPGRQGEAISEYEAAVRLNPDFSGAHVNLANLLSRIPGREAEAESHYRTALRLKPDYAEAENNLANLLAGLPGRRAEAEAHYEAALRLWPDFPKAHYNLANFLSHIAGREADAETHYKAALSLKPDYAEAHCSLALLLEREPGRLAEAIEHDLAALRLQPDYTDAHNNLGALLVRLPGRRADAEAHYRAALGLRPDYAEAHNNLALLLAGEPGREREALAEFDAALRINPKFAQAHANLAFELAKDPRRAGEALAHYDTALALDAGNVVAQNNLANLLATIPGRDSDARAHYEAALRLDPGYAEAHNNLANVLSKDPSRLAEAVSHYERALQLRPDFAEAHFNLAVALANLGRIDESVAQFRKTLEIRPDFQAAREDLARLLNPDARSP